MTSLAGIENDLTEHGLAFLTRSISSYRDEESSKGPLFAVVDVAVAIEALLKARLAREHWSLLLADPDRTDATKFKSGQAKTVIPTVVVSRLKQIAGVTLPGKTEDVEEVFQLRNRTLHFTVPGDLDSIGVRATYGRALNAALAILQHEFRGQVEHEIDDRVHEVTQMLIQEIGEIDSLVKSRINAIDGVLSEADFRLECPRCGQVTLAFSAASGEVACAFCLWRPESPEDAAHEYLTTVLGGTEYELIQNGEAWPIWECPDCGHEAAVRVTPPARVMPETGIGTPPRAAFYACFGCAWHGSTANLYPCGYCEVQLTAGGELCLSCLSYLADRE